MGITDEAYGDALIKQKAYVEQQMKEKQMSGLMNSLGNLIGAGQQQALNSNGLSSSAYAQQQATLAQNAHTTTGITLTTAGTGTPTWATREPLGVKTISEKDLQHDAMKAPLSALVDMWTMRWSGEWVNESEFDEDEFWRLALVRLLGANKLEKHNLANQYRSVYRIIE